MVVRKVGGSFKVLSKAGKVLGTHKTRAAALKQLAAVEAAKAKRGKAKGYKKKR
jgi:hypothetical protein